MDFERRSIVVLTNDWKTLNLQYFGRDFCICAYKYLKIDKRRINFYELPKINSRIKVQLRKI